MIPTQTLNRFIMARGKEHPEATGELSDLLSTIAVGVKMISHLVSSANLRGLHGMTCSVNVQGEQTQNLDQFSNEILTELLASSRHFGLLVSEETDQVIPTGVPVNQGKYVVAFDPLDGSSNLGVNVAVGTIFGIFRRRKTDGIDVEDFFQPGSQMVAAGYAVYGSTTTFVYSTGDGVHEFTLDPAIGEFLLTDGDLKYPEKSGCYSTNEGNSILWETQTTKFVQIMKSKDEKLGTPYSARYIGSLVADFHRNLKKGGIFLYPGDKKNSRGKLRLLYECMPMAFIAEHAGGSAIDGEKRILDIVPRDIHERCPLIVGNSKVVELYRSLR